MTSVSRLAGPRVETNRRPIRRRTAAESATHDDIIRFFFRGLFLFVFFSFATPCPCFSSFLFFGAAPAERKMKQKTRQTQETEKRRTHKSQAFWRFFLRGETAKSVRTRRRCCFSRRRERKKSKLLGWRSDTKGTSIPPQPGEGVGRLSPRTPFCPPFSGELFPLGGAVALPTSHDFWPSTGTFTSPFTSSPITPPTSSLLSPSPT